MELNAVLRQQSGVIARRQVLALGMTDNDIERLVRRRVWARVCVGVYINHTGPLSELQRDWAAILAHPAAALAGRSALRRAGIATGSDHQPREKYEVEVVVPHRATARVIPDVRVRRSREFHRIVHPSRMPPTMRIEEAALDVAQDASETDAVAVLSDACRSRKTTARRLMAAASHRSRLRQRAFILGVLTDADEGTHSVLESRYLRDVERAHALPNSRRQEPGTKGKKTAYRDVAYQRHQLVVELDGRLGHDLALDRWADLDRDLVSAAAGLLTVRLGWGQALAPCRTASAIAGVLSVRGWSGTPQACGTNCGLVSSSGGIVGA